MITGAVIMAPGAARASESAASRLAHAPYSIVLELSEKIPL